MANIKITLLGGVREFGKNMYLVEVDDTLFVLDAGLKYPETEMLGVDFVIADMEYLVENASKVAGIFLTHGHADSIGALPYLLAEVEAPVFGSELTIELAKINTKNYDATKDFKDFHKVDESTEIDFGAATISFFSTTHTIPESLGIVIGTKEGAIVYTGDFKFDPSVAKGYKTNLGRLSEIGNQGVLALLSTSANALSSQQSASETEIYDQMYDTIADWEGRVVIASNSGNLGRIQQAIDIAIELGRKVAFSGQDLDKIIDTARRLGKLHIDDDRVLVKIQDIKRYKDGELLIIESGRMGEPLKALEEMASHRHKNVSIKEGDLVYTVTSPSLAFETLLAHIENEIYRSGGIMKSLGGELKISGHANARDLQFMLDLLRPKNLIPVQGNFRELQAHARLAMAMGIPVQHIFLAKRGESVSFKSGNMQPEGTVPAENVMIDGSGIGDIGSIVLRDRKVLSEDGIFIAVIAISRTSKKIISKAMVHTRGFVYVKTSRDLMQEAAELVNTTVEAYLAQPGFEWADIKSEIRDVLAKFLYDQTKRRPAVLPIVMEARSLQEITKNYKHPKK